MANTKVRVCHLPPFCTNSAKVPGFRWSVAWGSYSSMVVKPFYAQSSTFSPTPIVHRLPLSISLRPQLPDQLERAQPLLTFLVGLLLINNHSRRQPLITRNTQTTTKHCQFMAPRTGR